MQIFFSLIKKFISSIFVFIFTGKYSEFQYTFYADNDPDNQTDLLASTDIAQANANHIVEIRKYSKLQCANDINDLDQVRMFETIKHLYMKFNVIMPSEADIERIFSFGGMVMRPHRRHMKSDIFEKVIILKSNCYPHRKDQNETI